MVRHLLALSKKYPELPNCASHATKILQNFWLILVFMLLFRTCAFTCFCLSSNSRTNEKFQTFEFFQGYWLDLRRQHRRYRFPSPRSFGVIEGYWFGNYVISSQTESDKNFDMKWYSFFWPHISWDGHILYGNYTKMLFWINAAEQQLYGH